MKFPSKETVDKLRQEYPAGTRVALVRMDDVQAPPKGTKGTVTGVDDTGSLLVDWGAGCRWQPLRQSRKSTDRGDSRENGCGLNVVFGADKVVKLD